MPPRLSVNLPMDLRLGLRLGLRPPGRERPHRQVQAHRGGHGEYADQDGRAQHPVHSPQVYGRAARAASPARRGRRACSRPGPRG